MGQTAGFAAGHSFSYRLLVCYRKDAKHLRPKAANFASFCFFRGFALNACIGL